MSNAENAPDEHALTPHDGGRATLHQIHETVRQEGDHELQRSSSALAWSGLAAGLAMGFSLIAEGLLHHALPKQSWSGAISNFGYSLGFVIVILGRQQLFTENTITVVIPFLHNKSWQRFVNLARVWGIVLTTNLIGGLAIALCLAHTSLFDPPVRESFLKIGKQALAPAAGTVLLRGVMAGWLIALLVWLLPAAQSARLWVIMLIAYVVGLAHLAHVIAGSVEVFYVAAAGERGWGEVLLGYVAPALAGNIVGGVVLAALINHGQFHANR